MKTPTATRSTVVKVTKSDESHLYIVEMSCGHYKCLSYQPAIGMAVSCYACAR